jgi:hypothetical protein
MAITLYGAKMYQVPNNETNILYNTIGKTSEVMANGDLLTVSSGVLKVVAAATDTIAGVAVGALTAAQNDATKYVPMNPSDENSLWLMGCNSALTDNKTDFGTFYSITGTTGVHQINVSGGVATTTSRQVMIVEVDPQKIGGTDGAKQALVKFVRIPQFNGAFN